MELKGYKENDWSGIVKDWVPVFTRKVEGIKIEGIGGPRIGRIIIQEELIFWRKPYKTQHVEVKSEIKDKHVLYLDEIQGTAIGGMMAIMVPAFYNVLIEIIREKLGDV